MKSKLVRDRIPEIMKARGLDPVVYVAGDAEFRARLKDKLLEEVREFLTDETAEELADTMEVIRALLVEYSFDFREIERIRQKKFLERGGFSQKIVLEMPE